MIQKFSFPLTFAIIGLLAIACTDDKNSKNQSDGGADSGSDTESTSKDSEKPDTSKEDNVDTDEKDSDTDTDTDSDTDDEKEGSLGGPTLADYLPCKTDSDCPVGFGDCIRKVSLNAADAEGVSSVQIADIFPNLESSGICSKICTNGPAACDSMVLVNNDGEDVPFTCQLVVVGKSPYPEPAPDFPFDEDLDVIAMSAGVAFGAICRPPFGLDEKIPDAFCSECKTSADCGDGVCWDFFTQDESTDGATGACLIDCSGSKACPAGFNCDEIGSGFGSLCRPVEKTCGACRDLDGDGYGFGQCTTDEELSTSVDCDDRNPEAYFAGSDMNHPFPKNCGEFDYNCNGLSDAVEQIEAYNLYGVEHCGACYDRCEGRYDNSTSLCRERDGIPTCVAKCTYPEAWVDCDDIRETGCETPVHDPSKLCFFDLDGDDLGDPNNVLFACDEVEDGGPIEGMFDGGLPDGGIPGNFKCVRNHDDCDDANPAQVGDDCQTEDLGECGVGLFNCKNEVFLVCDPINLDAPYVEECNGKDDDCDGETDEYSLEWPAADCVVEDKIGRCREGKIACNGESGVYCKQVVMEETEIPGDDFDGDCDAFDGDLDRAVFVAPSSGGDGSIDNPYGSLQTAIDTAYERGHDVYAAVGTYTIDQSLDLKNGVGVYGGYRRLDPGQGPWPMDTTAVTKIKRVDYFDDLDLIGLNGVYLIDLTAIRNITIEVESPYSNGASAYGIRCHHCSGLILHNTTISTGSGRDGSSMLPGETGIGGEGGVKQGQNGQSGSAGATGGCANGGAGGSGSNGSVYAQTGLQGEPSPGSGGLGGDAVTDQYSSGDGLTGGAGYMGEYGIPAFEVQAAGGAPASYNTDSVVDSEVLIWSAGQGEKGADGSDGSGGGGGGGAVMKTGYGYGGGGGGSSGCAGEGGQGADPGGSSIGLMLTYSSGMELIDVTVNVGNGGNGGSGGFGGNGGNGGDGGSGSQSFEPSSGIAGGAGGAGGSGSGGNGGGGGGGGDSICLLYDITTLNLVATTVECNLGSKGEGGQSGQPGQPGTTTGGAPSTEQPTAGLAGEPGRTMKQLQF